MEDESFGFIEDEILEIVRRYERMRNDNQNLYFDVSEFETIIDYYLELNDVNYAYDAAESAAEQHPEASSIKLRRARVSIDRGRAVDALKTIKAVENIEPSNYEVHLIKGSALGMMGDIKGAARCFDKALAVDPTEEITILLAITGILNNLNHYSLLTRYIKRLLEIEPNFVGHIYDLAFAYEKLGDYNQAIKHYLEYLDEEPFSDNAWYNLGVLYSKKGMDNKALNAYEYSLAINPENFFAIFNVANILSKEGNYSEALDYYLRYLEFEDESSEAMTYAAECYESLGEDKKAMDMYREAIDLDPGFSQPWYGIGLLLLDRDPAESIRYLRKAVELKDDETEYWYYLSEAYSSCDRLKDSLRSLIKALNIDPYYDSAWLRIGELILRDNYSSHAPCLLEKAVRIIGDVHGIRYLLASVYLKEGNDRLFKQHLRKALNESPENFLFFSSLFPVKLMDRKTLNTIKKYNKKIK